jgi:multiple sugar transport system substrate-binding protein
MRRAAQLLVLAAAAACAAADARTTLTVTNWADWQEQRLEERFVGAFALAHPGVRVSMQAASNQAEYRDQILTSIAAGAPPDAFYLDNIDVPAFAASGAVLDLAPYAARVGLPLERFDPRVLSIFLRDGKLWAFPKGFTPMVIAYNKDLFDRAHLRYPPLDWTWEQFRATAKALTRDTDGDGRPDQYGFWLDRRAFMWIASLWALGGDVLCEDGARASGCLDSPASIRAFRDLTGLAVRDSVTPRFYGLRRSLGDNLRNLYTGRVAMMPAGHFWIPAFRPHVLAHRMRVGFTTIPYREGLAPATVLYAAGVAVPALARSRRLSVELAGFLVDSLAQTTRAAGGLELPAIASIAERVAAQDTTGWEAVFLHAARSGRQPWGARIAKWREVEAILPDIMDRVIMNGEDVEAVLHDVARRLDAVLAPGRGR